MGEFVRSQNVARYRRLLERVTDESDRQQIINLLAEERQKQKTLAIWSGSFDGGELRQAAELSGRPLNHYDALGITVAGLGEVQDQARRPCGERAKVGHSLCDHRDVASNLDLHIWGVTVEACSHLGDVIGCVSHSKLHRNGIKDLCLSSFYWRWPHSPVRRPYLDPFVGFGRDPSADNATTSKRNSMTAVFINDGYLKITGVRRRWILLSNPQ